MFRVLAEATDTINPLDELLPPSKQMLDIPSATTPAGPILVDVALLYGAYLKYDLALYALEDAVTDVTPHIDFRGHNAWNDVIVCMPLTSHTWKRLTHCLQGTMNVFLSIVNEDRTSPLRDLHTVAFRRVYSVVHDLLASSPPPVTKASFTSLVNDFVQRNGHEITFQDKHSGPAHAPTWTIKILSQYPSNDYLGLTSLQSMDTSVVLEVEGRSPLRKKRHLSRCMKL